MPALAFSPPLQPLVYWLIWIAAGANLIFVIREFIFIIKDRPGKIFTGLLLILSTVILWIAGDIAVRGGYHNDHDFTYLSFNFSGFPAERGFFWHREISPLAMTAIIDWITGDSLGGILLSQKFLWFSCSLLLYSALRHFGIGFLGTAGAVMLFSFNYLAILNMHTFSTVYIHLFYFFSALCAVSGIWAGASKRGMYAAWFLISSFLVAASRVELFPVPLLALCFAAALRRDSPKPFFWKALGFCAALGLITLIWVKLAFLDPSSTDSLNRYFSLQAWKTHLNANLGIYNLSVITPVIPEAIAPLVLFFWACLAFIFLWRKNKNLFLLCLFTGIWIIYFSEIYHPFGRYRLQLMRHHLYFLIPFVWLAAAVSAAAAQWVQKKWARMAFVAALAPVYIFLNLKEAAALRKDLRTNDLEWQFLLQESSRWPQSCRVYYPFHDSRRGILKKYFRFLSHAEEAEGCVLVYRSPVQDIFPAEAQTQQIKFNSLAGNPYREIRFKHRFYTTWDSSAETKNPITVTAGFYYLRPDKKEQVRAYVLFEKGLSLFAQGRVKQALENFEKAVSIWPQDPRFFLSAAAVRMMGEEDGENGRELEYLNRSLELARRERNPDLEAEIYSTLAYFWQKRGRNDLAAGYIKKAP